MIRALCPVCKTPQPLNDASRIEPHRRRTNTSPLLRAKGVRNGTPCEGAGRIPHKPP